MLNLYYCEQRFQKLSYILTVEPIYRIFCCITWPAVSAEADRDPQNILDLRKVARIFRRRKVASVTSSERATRYSI